MDKIVICSVDPGLKGGACVMDGGGEILRLDPMPLQGGKVTAEAIARLYRDIQVSIGSREPPHLVIEEIYTPPSDAIGSRAIVELRGLFAIVGQYLTAVDGEFASADHIEAMRTAFKTCSPYADARVRVDGRTGLLAYSKGAGFLQMPALWGWPITEVKPSIWCRDMKQGVDRSLSTKDQSIKVAQSLWPMMFDRASALNFYASARCVKPHDGLVEAALMAEWLRRRLARRVA